MALSIEHQPQDRRPAFHPIPFEVSSTASGDTNYRYIFRIKQGATILRELKPRPRPVDGFGKIDLGPHLGRLIDQTTFDIKSVTDFQDAPVMEYDLDILSENALLPEVALQLTDLIAFNTVLDRNEYIGYNQDTYRLLGPTSKMLLNLEQDTKVLKDDFFWVHFMTDIGAARKLVVNQYDNTKSPVFAPAVETTFTPTVENNLGKIDLSTFIFNASTVYIGIKFTDGATSDLSEELFLQVCEPCAAWTRFKIVYLDSKGSYNSMNFDLKSTRQVKNNPKLWRAYIDPVTESDLSRGVQKYFIETMEEITVNSAVLSDEHNRMYKDLIKSTQVFLDVRNDPNWTNADFLPIEVLTKGMSVLEGENQDIIKYPLTFRTTTEIPTR